MLQPTFSGWHQTCCNISKILQQLLNMITTIIVISPRHHGSQTLHRPAHNSYSCLCRSNLFASTGTRTVHVPAQQHPATLTLRYYPNAWWEHMQTEAGGGRISPNIICGQCSSGAEHSHTYRPPPLQRYVLPQQKMELVQESHFPSHFYFTVS